MSHFLKSFVSNCTRLSHSSISASFPHVPTFERTIIHKQLLSTNSEVPYRDSHLKQTQDQYFGPILVEKDNSSYTPVTDYVKRSHMLYDGKPYYKLPMVRISARWNNTIITVYTQNPDLEIIARVSCRTAGFYNAKKKTDLAGETVGKLAARKSLERGCTEHVRVLLKGIGPGRKTSIDGLVMGGMKLVSISDITPLTMEGLPQRPRKIRRL